MVTRLLTISCFCRGNTPTWQCTFETMKDRFTTTPAGRFTRTQREALPRRVLTKTTSANSAGSISLSRTRTTKNRFALTTRLAMFRVLKFCRFTRRGRGIFFLCFGAEELFFFECFCYFFWQFFKPTIYFIREFVKSVVDFFSLLLESVVDFVS